MGYKQVEINVTKVTESIFNRIIELLLISLLVFMPFAFGAVEAWSEEVVIALVAAIIICFLLKLIVEENARLVWSWAYIPVALFIIVAVFQVIPLPTGLVSVISPNTAATKIELLNDLPNSENLLETMTLSFYPQATKHNLRLVLAVAAVFFVVVNIYRRENQIKRLLASIAIIGGSLVVLTLLQDLFGNGKIYWFISPEAGKAYSGTFVNHSHYGQFMNLSIGAALGLVLVNIHEAFIGKKVTTAVVFEYFSSPESKLIWFLLAMIVFGAATVFISLTRGGMISMLIAGGFITLVISSRQSMKGRGWIIVLMALVAFICVLYIGFDAVYDRLASIRELHEAEGGRWQILKDISLAWTKFPFLGTGLGTHEVVYPMFDRSTISALAAYAENEYAQTTEETGLIGLASLVFFGILVWINYVRNIKNPSIPICLAAYGLGFGLLAIMLHSLSDFGQHLPANAFLSAISCALLLTLSRIGRKVNPETEVINTSRSIRIIVLIVVSGVCIWALFGANNTRLAEAHWKKALTIEQGIINGDLPVSDETYAGLIFNTAKAADYQPENVKYNHWLNVYRWESISRTTDPNTNEIIISEKALEFVRRIVNELNNVRLLCPTYGAAYCVVGQLEMFILNDPNGANHIRRGFQLAPCDPTACFVAGLLDIEEQRINASFDKFNRAFELDGRFFQNAANIYINNVFRPDLAVTLAGDNSSRLNYVARVLADTEEHKDIVEQARARVVELLKEQCSRPNASASTYISLANIYRREGNYEAAIEHYCFALEMDYGQVQWRFNLANLLAEANRIPQAIHEARICLRLNPEFRPAEQLIANLSVLTGSAIEDNITP